MFCTISTVAVLTSSCHENKLLFISLTFYKLFCDVFNISVTSVSPRISSTFVRNGCVRRSDSMVIWKKKVIMNVLWVVWWNLESEGVSCSVGRNVTQWIAACNIAVKGIY
jgi:hypothetical protein